MTICIKNGWLQTNSTIQQVPSPNFDQRPNKHVDEINLLVVHHISLPPHHYGTGDIEAFFTNQLDTSQNPYYAQIANLRVSAHILIKRNGQILQFVSFDDRAWHAGESCYQGRTNCNDFSIGIELEGDLQTPYRYAQYAQLVGLTKALQANYPKIGERITGHENIAPRRKTDPGPTFDWARYQSALAIK